MTASAMEGLLAIVLVTSSVGLRRLHHLHRPRLHPSGWLTPDHARLLGKLRLTNCHRGSPTLPASADGIRRMPPRWHPAQRAG